MLAGAEGGAPPVPVEEPARPAPRREIALGLAIVALSAGLVALIPDLRHSFSLALHGDFEGLRHQFRGLGAWGVALLLGLMLAHAVVYYPTELATATAGFVYGFGPGLALSMGGWLASGLLAYLLGRTVGRPLAHRLFGRWRFARLEAALRSGGAPLLIITRLIPVMPFSLTGYVAGAARVGVWRFGWTTVVGYLPLTVLVAYLGSQAKSLSLSDPRLWLALVAFTMLLAAGRLLRIGRAPAPED